MELYHPMHSSSTCSFDSPRHKPTKLKIVMLGDQGVGKTSIIKSYTRGIFELKQPVHMYRLSQPLESITCPKL